MNKQALYDFMFLKAGLLAEGAYFSPEILETLKAAGKITDGTGLFKYHNQDYAPNEFLLSYAGEIYRIEVRQKDSAEHTSFSVTQVDNAFFLFDRLTGCTYPVAFPDLPSFEGTCTSSGKPIREIIRPMGPDFVRTDPDLRCEFASREERCRFCKATYVERLNIKNISDIVEAFQQAKLEMDIVGVFMSTGAFSNAPRTQFFADVIRIIRKELPSQQIVFALAPQVDRGNLNMLFESSNGNLILSFNLEAYDSRRWDANSPLCMGLGKTRRGRDFYFQAYNLALNIGGPGSVKSNFVLGLESLESLAEGVNRLAAMGVFSTGTIFYPTPGSFWQKLMDTEPSFSPTVREFANHRSRREFAIQAYLILAEAALKHGLPLSWNRESRISGLEWQARDYLLKT